MGDYSRQKYTKRSLLWATIVSEQILEKNISLSFCGGFLFAL